MEKNQNRSNIPLCVDLDGTLISTDTLMESMLLAIKLKPYIIFIIPLWLISGRANLKARLSNIVIPNPELLPYNQEVLDFIKDEKNKGRDLVLATATQRKIADSVASYLNIFNKVVASDEKHNLRSSRKANTLTELYGEKGFDYIGDSSADYKVWSAANGALLVNPRRKVRAKAEKESNVIKVFQSANNPIKSYIKQIRVHQWLKNILIFLPILMAHKIEFSGLINSFLAFISFSFIASFVYILNDLLDLESDRRHPSKKYRPLAAGKISIPTAVMVASILFVGGFSISLISLDSEFTQVLGIYFLITTGYSFYLKRIIILDIIVLSCLYTIRLVAGAAATDVEVSPWLLGFSIFFFLSLAIMKRFTELLVILKQNKTKTSGRGYKTDDIKFLRSIGPASGYLSILIFALYVNSDKVVSLYNTPSLLWMTLLCLIYWISRIWIIANRGQMHDDPIVFTAKDKISYIIGFITMILVIGASL